MNYSWNWSILFQEPYFGWLLAGLALTLVISLSAIALALIVGCFVGIVGAVPARIARIFAGTYISLFRNIPLLLQLFLWFFVLPELLPADWGRWLKRDLPYPDTITSILALGLFTAARVAVQVRAGIAAVSRGQRMAACASGMTGSQVYRLVILPQVLRVILPPLTSEFLAVFKNSAVALTIGVFELTAQTRQIESYTFQGFEAFTAATFTYLLVALLVTGGMHLLELRVALPGSTGRRS